MAATGSRRTEAATGKRHRKYMACADSVCWLDNGNVRLWRSGRSGQLAPCVAFGATGPFVNDGRWGRSWPFRDSQATYVIHNSSLA
jgi:hypothetical protein